LFTAHDFTLPLNIFYLKNRVPFSNLGLSLLEERLNKKIILILEGSPIFSYFILMNK
jgi:hypothetical protein